MKYLVSILAGLLVAVAISIPEPAQPQEPTGCYNQPIIHNLTDSEVEILLTPEGRWEVDIKPKSE